jgi:hypothetical protein
MSLVVTIIPLVANLVFHEAATLPPVADRGFPVVTTLWLAAAPDFLAVTPVSLAVAAVFPVVAPVFPVVTGSFQEVVMISFGAAGYSRKTAGCSKKIPFENSGR